MKTEQTDNFDIANIADMSYVYRTLSGRMLLSVVVLTLAAAGIMYVFRDPRAAVTVFSRAGDASEALGITGGSQTLALAAALAILGTLAGSYLTRVVYRVPRRISLMLKSSCCMCQTELRFVDRIPVVSFFALRRSCRHCGQRISPMYPLVETLTGFLFGAVALEFGLSAALPSALFLTAFLVVVTFINLETGLVLDRITLPAIPVGIGLVALQGLGPALTSAAGVVVGGGILLLVAFLSKGGMGGGNIKMAAVMGAILNFWVLIALWFAFVVPGIIWFLHVVLRRNRSRSVQFVPYLAAGALFALFFGPEFWSWYSASAGW